MKHYTIEDNARVDLSRLEADRLTNLSYESAHRGLIIICHDIFIEYEGRILLVKRDINPAKGELWPIGGRAQRGMPYEQSVESLAKKECNLILNKIKHIGEARTSFSTDPFGHGRGTDTHNLIYFAIGEGTIKFDDAHSHPTLISPEEFKKMKNTLHPYVQDFIKKILFIETEIQGHR